MSNQWINIEEIIRYLDGDMKQDEADNFEERLFHDKKLQNDFIMIKEIEDYLKDKDSRKLTKTFFSANLAFKEYESFQNDMEQLSIIMPAPDKWYNTFYKVAALLIFVFTTAFILSQLVSNSKSKTEYLYTKYYESCQMVIREYNSQDNFKKLAIDAYDKKQFKTAILYFDKALSTDSSLIFYKAVANLECEQYKKALECFQVLLKDESNIYFVETNWYTALTWLKLNQPENAKPYLQWLVQNSRYYGIKSSSILKEL